MHKRTQKESLQSSGKQGDWFALTLPQMDFWEEFRLHPFEPLSTVAHCLELTGDLDIQSLMKAIERMGQEAAVFSLRFKVEDRGKKVFQCIDPDRSLTVEFVDLEGERDPLGMAMAWMNKDIEVPLDLLGSELTRQVVFKLEERRYLWFLRTHHILVDGYSMSLIARRVAELYSYFCGVGKMGKSFDGYRDLVDDEFVYTESEKFFEDRIFWREYLGSDVEPRLIDKRAETYGGGGLHREIWCSEKTIAILKQVSIARCMGWPDVLTLLSALYLHGKVARKESRGGSSLVWIPYMGRWGSVAMNVPALTVNILPLKVNAGMADGLENYLDEGVRVMRQQRQHGRYRVEQMAFDRNVPDNSRFFFSPLINVLPFDEASFIGLSCKRHVLAAGPGDGFNLTFRGDLDRGGLSLNVDGDACLMEPAQFCGHCEGIAAFLHACLKCMVHGSGCIGDCFEMTESALGGEFWANQKSIEMSI